jgi:anti-anti-sigma factor
VLRERDSGGGIAEIGLTDSTAVVRLAGELDASVAFALADLEGKEPDRLIFEMAAVSFLDCAAAGVLFGAARSILPAGTRPVIASAGPRACTLLELAAWTPK